MKRDRPDAPRTIHDGARVAPQQCSILRVDELSVEENGSAGKVSADGKIRFAGALYIRLVPGMEAGQVLGVYP